MSSKKQKSSAKKIEQPFGEEQRGDGKSQTKQKNEQEKVILIQNILQILKQEQEKTNQLNNYEKYKRIIYDQSKISSKTSLDEQQLKEQLLKNATLKSLKTIHQQITGSQQNSESEEEKTQQQSVSKVKQQKLQYKQFDLEEIMLFFKNSSQQNKIPNIFQGTNLLIQAYMSNKSSILENQIIKSFNDQFQQIMRDPVTYQSDLITLYSQMEQLGISLPSKNELRKSKSETRENDKMGSLENNQFQDQKPKQTNQKQGSLYSLPIGHQSYIDLLTQLVQHGKSETIKQNAKQAIVQYSKMAEQQKIKDQQKQIIKTEKLSKQETENAGSSKFTSASQEQPLLNNNFGISAILQTKAYKKIVSQPRGENLTSAQQKLLESIIFDPVSLEKNIQNAISKKGGSWADEIKTQISVKDVNQETQQIVLELLQENVVVTQENVNQIKQILEFATEKIPAFVQEINGEITTTNDLNQYKKQTDVFKQKIVKKQEPNSFTITSGSAFKLRCLQ